jgi:hypothetical protein
MTTSTERLVFRNIAVLVIVAGGAFAAGRLTQSPDAAENSVASRIEPTAVGEARVATPVGATGNRSTATTTRAASPDPVGVSAELEKQAQDAQSLSSPATRRNEIRRIYRELSLINPDEAVASAQALTDPFTRRSALETVIETVSETDPALALTLIDHVTNKAEQRALRNIAIGALALHDPVSALDYVAALPTPDQSLTTTVMTQWTTYDPQNAAAYALNKLDNYLFSNAFRACIATWLTSEPRVAMDWVMSIQAELSMQERHILFNQIAANTPEALEQVADQLPRNIRHQVNQRRLIRLAREDPAGAVAMLEQVSDRQQRVSLMRQIAEEFPKRDVNAGLSWINTLDDDDRRLARKALYRAWLRERPDEALAGLERLDSVTRQQLVPTISEALASQDGERALNWLLSNSKDGPQAQTLMQVTFKWLHQDRERAIEVISEQQNEPWAASAISLGISAIAADDPVEAKRWFDSLTNDNAKSAALPTISATIARQGADAAIRWIESLPKHQRNKAYSGAVSNNYVTYNDAIQLIKRIDDRGLRRRAVETYAYQLVYTSPAVAIELAHSEGLSDAAISRIKKVIDNY